MFPAIMSWPITLAPMSEAIRRETHAKKTFIRKNINLGSHVRCKDSITIKKEQDVVWETEE
jgi:hypothetical protein